MDNYKKVQMNKIEYENMKIVSPINSIKGSKKEMNIPVSKQFRNVMKNIKGSAKNRKTVKNKMLDEDLVVESSLQKLITENHEIGDIIEEKVSESKLIKKILYEDDEILKE